MKTIGFIDNHIDQWHAHNYPAMIRQNASHAGEFAISLAWAKVDPPGKMPLAEWCKKNEVRKADSLRQVVENCDCLVVLAPDTPETHEELADLALKSGKPTYIDKPLATSRAAAQRLFDLAAAHHTPMMSCSALRCAQPLVDLVAREDGRRSIAHIRGGGVFDIYAIHQVEMLTALLGCGGSRVRRLRKGSSDVMMVDFGDDRFGTISLMPGHPFEFSVRAGDQTVCSGPLSDFFPRFVNAMLAFFMGGQTTVPVEQTLEIAAIVEAGRAAITDDWVTVPTQ